MTSISGITPNKTQVITYDNPRNTYRAGLEEIKDTVQLSKKVSFSGKKNEYAHLDEYLIKGEPQSTSLLAQFKSKISNFAFSSLDNLHKYLEKASVKYPEMAEKSIPKEAFESALTEIEQAKKLGVELKVPYNASKIAEEINVLLVKLKEQGHELPKSIRVLSEVLNKVIQSNNIGGSYNLFSKKILLSRDFLFTSGYLKHEIGHFLHHLHNNKLYKYLYKNNFSFKPEYKEMIAQHVNDYASSNPLEFVAEVFKGLFDGKQYDEKIMELYKKFKGVPFKRYKINKK